MALLKEIGFDCRELQAELNEHAAALGFQPLSVDDKCGGMTIRALRAYQSANGLAVDGVPGPLTLGKLGLVLPDRDDIDRPEFVGSPDPRVKDGWHPAQQKWPRERDMVAFYGAPGNPQCTAGFVNLPIKMRVLADDAKTTVQTVAGFNCHAKCEKAFEDVFEQGVRHYGETKFRALNLDVYSGCYNKRLKRGGSTWSMHSWGSALDQDAQRNMLKTKCPKAEFCAAAYDAWWDIVESFGGVSLGRQRDFDWMHWQFARL